LVIRYWCGSFIYDEIVQMVWPKNVNKLAFPINVSRIQWMIVLYGRDSTLEGLIFSLISITTN
jgi:hypothetical protein